MLPPGRLGDLTPFRFRRLFSSGRLLKFSCPQSPSRALTTKNCEVCGSSFECKALLGCWCRLIKVPRKQLTELSDRASDCVCPSCLGKLRSGGLNSSS
ncbi:MAG TPA: cysteine-rich CWC family protein [Candidatus Bathyarchaeia archaeon]|nr:cysteine-rich CWC family protein [Candidatus Bathyarchaeia archaeon]